MRHASLCSLIGAPLFLPFQIRRFGELRKTISEETRLLFSRRLPNVADRKITRMHLYHLYVLYNILAILLKLGFLEN